MYVHNYIHVSVSAAVHVRCLYAELVATSIHMQIELNVACQKPELVDLEIVAAELPYGQVTPKAVFGGLNVFDDQSGRMSVIANAGIIVRLPL